MYCVYNWLHHPYAGATRVYRINHHFIVACDESEASFEGKATPSKFLVSHFIDLKNTCGWAGDSLSIIHYKYFHEIRSYS